METLDNDFLLVMIRTGLFFAKCDGEYVYTEKLVIDKLKEQLDNNSRSDPEYARLVKLAEMESYTIDKLVNQTSQLLEKANEQQSEMMKNQLIGFVRQVVMADGLRRLQENNTFKMWREKLGF